MIPHPFKHFAQILRIRQPWISHIQMITEAEIDSANKRSLKQVQIKLNSSLTFCNFQPSKIWLAKSVDTM